MSSRGQHEPALRQIDRLFSDGTFAAKSDFQLLERYAKERDGEAFAALVARHGSMVLSVCRDVARDAHDADDAFQATFLVLAKKAHARWTGDSLGGWLYRVAHRAALRGRLESKRRTAREQRVAVSETAVCNSGGPWADVIPLLHAEIDRLPEKFRAPIVLCELETLTRDEAALRLGWPSGTVASRLARARGMLRSRLVRRGIESASVSLGAMFATRTAGAALPSPLAHAAHSIALSVAANRGGIDATVLEIAEGVLKSMVRSKVQRLTFVGLVAGAVLGLGLFAVAMWQDDAKITLTGVVVDGDGKPVEGATIVSSFRDRNGGPAEVTARTRSDNQGNYRLSVPRLDGDPRRFWASAVWAYAPGRLVAAHQLGPLVASSDVPVRLVVGKPARTLFEIRGPDGKPIAGAKISPRVVGRGRLSIPDALGDQIGDGVVTDAHGSATMAAFFPEEVQSVFVSAPGLGTQHFGSVARNDGNGLKSLALSPVGRLKGRLIGASESIAGVGLRVISSSGRPFASGFYEVSTDKDGRFEIAEIPAGHFTIAGQAGADGRWYVKFDKGGVIEQGKTTEIEAPLEKSIRVSGVVREKGANRPIENVLLSFYGMNTSLLKTDGAGRFHGYAIPGKPRLSFESVPAGFAMPFVGIPVSTIPEGASEFAIPPIELERAASVWGLVEDERGQPVAGVIVAATLAASRRDGRPTPRLEATRSDAQGMFQVLGLPPDAEVWLKAHLGALRTSKDVIARGGARVPVRLRVDRSSSVGMSGRVVNELGRPISGAQVHFRALRRFASGEIERDELVDLDGDCALATNIQGGFETPTSFDRQGEYIAFASAKGFRPEQTAIVAGSAGEFPTIRLHSIRWSVSGTGRVIDRQGRPVAGAEVWLSSETQDRVRTTSDTDGRFRWDTVENVPLFLFARKDGFRFHGQIADFWKGAVTVTLTRTDETPRVRLTALPPVIATAEAIQLARRAVEPIVAAVLETHRIAESPRLPVLLATVDPARALVVLNEKADGKALFADSTRVSSARALSRRNMDDAKALAETITDPARKSSAYHILAHALPEANRDGKRALLDQSLQLARQVVEPGERVSAFGFIAEGYLDIGDRERAIALLREAEPEAEKLATTGSAGSRRRLFAAALAGVDLPAALKLLEGVGDDARREGDRSMLSVIQTLASQDPAEVERLLKGVKPFTYYNRMLPRIGYLIAAKEPESARRVIRTYVDLSNNAFLKPYALGMSALGAASAHPQEAAKLLHESLALLEAPAAQGQISGIGSSSATTAACLLPVVERVAPDILEEVFWRALSYRNPIPRQSAAATQARSDLALSIFLARYDREVARMIFDPVAEQVETLNSFPVGAFAYAGAEIDPKATLARIEALSDRPGLTPNGSSSARSDSRQLSPRNDARQAFALWLAADPALRWAMATENVLGLWSVDGEYVY